MHFGHIQIANSLVCFGTSAADANAMDPGPLDLACKCFSGNKEKRTKDLQLACPPSGLVISVADQRERSEAKVLIFAGFAKTSTNTARH